MAPRSGQVMLSCPSSLQGHSDFPTSVTPVLSVSSNLSGAYRSRSSAETLGSQVPHRYLSPHAIGLTPGPMQVLMPFTSLHALAFSLYVKDRRVSPAGFIPHPDSPNYYRPGTIYEAAPFASCYGLRFWPAPLVGYDPLLCEPSRYRVRASSARMLPCEPAPCLHIHKGN